MRLTLEARYRERLNKLKSEDPKLYKWLTHAQNYGFNGFKTIQAGIYGMSAEDIKAWQDTMAKQKVLADKIAVGMKWKFKNSGHKLEIKSVDQAKERVAIDYERFKGIEISFDDLKHNAEPEEQQ